ncbi:hypothetical protein AMECASPLE_022366 [Ameca splendens]|uniref:Uncharacterized protein n=1 Tax=Ameca splendens TaxID=208324 RepID=A0ABV0Y3Y0_9TELE
MFRCSPSEQLCGCRQVELHHPVQTPGRVQDSLSETRSSSHSVLARRPRPHVDARCVPEALELRRELRARARCLTGRARVVSAGGAPLLSQLLLFVVFIFIFRVYKMGF